jgi:DNA-binding response OmpR family regulator
MKSAKISPQRILIVEDERSICAICRRVFESEGLTVDVADEGQTGQEMIDKQAYGLYVFDIKMPLMDGKELFRWMQEKYPESTKKVLFITGNVLDGDTDDLKKQCNRPILFKPFTPDELKNAVAECLCE